MKCPNCKIDKPASGFYIRKKHQAGQTTGPCIACNTEDCRLRTIARNLKRRKEDGTLAAYITELECRITETLRVLAIARKLAAKRANQP